ncbi:Gll0911 protein [hydrothermal vent metagenome]|uniref:Gll0911 protein n=1 Tax=hydrothermal vent metagenome TaxID=652676 RepID=A0A1W1CEU3_9ZZZZ
MKLLSIVILSISLLSASATKATLGNTKQLIVVKSANWTTPNATLQRFEKRPKGWQQVGKTIQVVIGKNGLGWGIGLHKIPKNAKYIKREGDGKAPSGVFRLKNGFGYQPYSIKFPYSVYRSTDHCVDDSNSKWYNQIVDSTKIKIDYSSYESMKFAKNYYKYGIVVDHNPNHIPKAGSCIFMHIKKPNKIPTVGCTAMSQSEIKEILKWLDPSKHPLLIQAPEDEIKRLLPFKTK